MAKTVTALNLSLVDFVPGLGHDGNTLLYHRGVHIFRRDLGTDRNPFHVRPDEQHLKHDPDMLKRYIAENTQNVNRI